MLIRLFVNEFSWSVKLSHYYITRTRQNELLHVKPFNDQEEREEYLHRQAKHPECAMPDRR